MTQKSKKTYVARFERDEDGSWTATARISARETAVSDGSTLEKARSRIRDSIATLLDVDEDAFLVEDDVVLPESAKRAVDAHARAKAELEQLTRVTRRAAQLAVVELTTYGLPMREVGRMLGITGPRVHQVIVEAKSKGGFNRSVQPYKTKSGWVVREVPHGHRTDETFVHGRTGKRVSSRKTEGGRKGAG